MVRVLLTLLAVVALGACGSSAPVAAEQPTPQIVYVTPEPTVAATPEITPAPTPEPTPEPIEEITPEPESSPEGVALGEWARVGDWDVRITKVNWNAGKALQKANMFNEKVPKGKVAVMAYVEGVYRGDGRESLDPMGSFRAMGSSMVEYSMFEGDTCGVLPEPEIVLNDPTVRNGGKVKGWGACWVVDKSDVDGLIAFWVPMWEDDITGFWLR
jgi:hypothetical protein